jgi:cell division protein FtsZ
MANGADRARIAAEAAVKSPLLEDVNLQGARGVLVNITASAGLRMKEYHEVMNTIREFMAEDALVIVGTVINDTMEDRLRVTMVATGLGSAAAKQHARPPNISLVEPAQLMQRTGTDNVAITTGTVNYEDLEQPAVVRRGRSPPAGTAPAFDAAEIPAFLRKQAD